MTSGPRDGQHKRAQVTRPSSDSASADSPASPATEAKRLRTQYQIVQQRGQRKYGPPSEWDNIDPPKGTELYVSKIPKDMLEDELMPVFEQLGAIYEMRLMMETNNTNKGFAFVKYCKKEDAEAALLHLPDQQIRPDCHLNVARSIDNNRIFIGNIPKSFSTEHLFAQMGSLTAGVAKVILYPSVNDRAKNRGYGFVQYETHQHAATARQKLMSNPTLWGGQEVKVDWAEPEIAVDEEVMRKVKVLYVRNLALTTTEQQLQDLFASGGSQIERVRKMHDYAFIHFATRDQAEEAKDKYTGVVLDGCEIDISWSKPVSNKEEYQQRKAMSKAMYRGPTAPLATGLSLHGEPFLMNQRLRNAAGSQGFTPKHMFNKLKQCETPLGPMHQTAMINPNNLITCGMTMKNPLEVGLTSPMPPYTLDKLSPEEAMGQSIHEIANQHAMQNSWMPQQYMMPPLAHSWNNQGTAYPAQIHPGQNYVPAPYLVQPAYTVFDSTYNPYACAQFYPGPMLASMPSLNGSALSVCSSSDAYTPR